MTTSLIKNTAKRLAGSIGLEISRKRARPDSTPVELTPDDRRVFDYICQNRLTMSGRERLAATIMACRHVCRNEIPGDFVECGAWRGGQSIAAKLTFENCGSSKRVFVFDTFAGMTPPTDKDSTAHNSKSALERFVEADRGDVNEWCYASIEDVKRNFEEAGADLSTVRFVKGDVRETLKVANNLPEQISVLRLDTDFYDSTLAELEALYPRLSPGGVLILDDYGHWDGARRAVDEYFGSGGPLLVATDYSGRVAVKTH